jgi:tellurite resistance protein TehA-like permease
MGTGISAILIHSFPYKFQGQREISMVVFLLVCGSFETKETITQLTPAEHLLVQPVRCRVRHQLGHRARGSIKHYRTCIRYAIWPSVFGLLLGHNVQSLFLGTFPMGLSTITNMTVTLDPRFSNLRPHGGFGMLTDCWLVW